VRTLAGVGLTLTLVALAGAPGAQAAAAPVVTAISPNNGPAAGGTTVTISGSGFTIGATVQFGGLAAKHVTVGSAGSITAVSPAGGGTVDVRVLEQSGTSASTPPDQFAYDPPPRSPWLGLNGNGYTYLGPVGTFVEQGIAFDRSGPVEWGAGERLKERGRETAGGEALAADMSEGMIPDITIEYAGYQGCGWGEDCLPTGAAAKAYVEGFIASAREILAAYPGAEILFEASNEPWGHGSASQYASILAQLLPEAQKAGIPLEDLYVGATGKHWVRSLYAAQPSLRGEIEAWYAHPYGPPHGTREEDSQGIQSLPALQSEMTSGQNNIVVSEIGFCTPDVNKGKRTREQCADSDAAAENSGQAAEELTEMLENALPYHLAGWLRALIVYSRNDGGYAMQLSSGKLTAQGKALEAFAETPAAEALAPGAQERARLLRLGPQPGEEALASGEEEALASGEEALR